MDLNKTVVAITGVAGGSPLAAGHSVTLIDKVKGKPKSIKAAKVPVVGATKKYDFTVAVAGGKLVATVNDVRANAAVTKLALSSQGGLTALNQATDSLTGAISGAAAAGKIAPGPTFFGTSSGGQNLAYNLTAGQEAWSRPGGSEAGAMTTGLGWSSLTSGGDLLMVGSFIEKGRSDYHNFSGYSHLDATGGTLESNWQGAGLFSRFETANGFYLDGSFRSGRLNQDSGDRRDIGAKAQGLTYWAGHAGLGQVWQFNNEVSLEGWARYTQTRLSGSGFDLTDDRLRVEALESRRAQAGARLSWNPEERVRAYAGLAYEHEFDGGLKSSLRDVVVETPGLRGASGMGELGLSLNLAGEVPMSLDLGVQGWTGQREGVSGSLKLSFEF